MKWYYPSKIFSTPAQMGYERALVFVWILSFIHFIKFGKGFSLLVHEIENQLYSEHLASSFPTPSIYGTILSSLELSPYRGPLGACKADVLLFPRGTWTIRLSGKQWTS